MAKPPKRTTSGKKPPHSGGGRRHERSAERPSAPPDRSSKRGSFRKREQGQEPPRGGDSRKATPKQGAARRPEREERPRRFEDRQPRRHAGEDRAFAANAGTGPKAPRLKADLFGFHAVREAWKNPGRFVHALYVTEAAQKEFDTDSNTAAKRPAPTIVTKEELDKAFPPGTVHQGIALSCQPLAEISVMDIIIKAQAKAKSVIVMLDQVTDPHNIGAILRSACAFGADGVVMQTRHAPEMDGILAKTACGAVDHIPIAYETNLSRALEKLKDHHYTVIGLDEHAPKTFGDLYKYERAVIVLGAEGPGMRRLIKEHCDVLVTLPTQKPINSLNVSNAAAVALYALTA